MKQTLLEIVQDIMYSMDGEEVTSIDDNYESKQIARIVRECYNNIVPKADLPEHSTLFQLEQTATALVPTIMSLPSDCIYLEWLKYDRHLSTETDSQFKKLDYVCPEEFFFRMHYLQPSTDTTVTSFTYTVNNNALTFLVKNDQSPAYYTTWDDATIAFNSFDSAVETYLSASKFLAYGKQDQTFTLADGYVPMLDSEQFPLLVQEAKGLAFAQMKQMTHVKAEKEAKRQWTHLGRSKDAVNNADNYYQSTPNYGRK